MEKITLDKITGFRVVNPYEPVIIRDKRGILFYSTEDMTPRVTYFNMPAGEFFVDSGWIEPVGKPRRYELATLPPHERDYGAMENFTITYEPNPNKCTVYWDLKEIVFDTSFMERPIPEVMFILFHEYGHRYFETEKFADLYASNRMKLSGYNPSQIALAQVGSLSERQQPRKEFLVNRLIETLN